MTVPMEDYIAELLSACENVTGERHSRIAGDMDISISNYYLYRNGKGNPARKTTNKIVTVVQLNHPEIIIRVTEKHLRQIYLECLNRGVMGGVRFVSF